MAKKQPEKVGPKKQPEKAGLTKAGVQYQGNIQAPSRFLHTSNAPNMDDVTQKARVARSVPDSGIAHSLGASVAAGCSHFPSANPVARVLVVGSDGVSQN